MAAKRKQKTKPRSNAAAAPKKRGFFKPRVQPYDASLLERIPQDYFQATGKTFPVTIAFLGDFHVPGRAQKIPAGIMAAVAQADVIMSTGDFIDEQVLEELKKLNKPVFAVKGNCDYLELPGLKILKIGKFSVGVIHGHQVHPRGDRPGLLKFAKDMKLNVLAYGHTHTLDVWRRQGMLFLGPGSATGAWGGDVDHVKPHCILLRIEHNRMSVRKI